LILTSLPHPQEKTPAARSIAEALGSLWASGIGLDWHAIHRGETRRRVSLPPYCFDRHRYWVERRRGNTTAVADKDRAIALDSALSASVSQIDVSTNDLPPRIKGTPTWSGDSVSAETPMQEYPRPNLSSPYLAPRDTTEEVVAKEWTWLLGLSKPGVNDDFLESGGHSLKAVQLISHLNKLFQVEITIGEFFESPTIAGIANALRRAEGTAGQVDAIAQLRRELDGMSREALEEWLQNEERSGPFSGPR
jgi:phthiocerol/phenolphthiocerol synthesis type-I polyketide synthase E